MKSASVAFFDHFLVLINDIQSFNEPHNSFKGPSGSMRVSKLAYGAPGGGGRPVGAPGYPLPKSKSPQIWATIFGRGPILQKNMGKIKIGAQLAVGAHWLLIWRRYLLHGVSLAFKLGPQPAPGAP